MSATEREKIYLAVALSYLARYFHTHACDDLVLFVRTIYAANATRLIERDLHERIKEICLQRLAALFEAQLVGSQELEANILKLIDDDAHELDEYRKFVRSSLHFRLVLILIQLICLLIIKKGLLGR